MNKSCKNCTYFEYCSWDKPYCNCNEYSEWIMMDDEELEEKEWKE